MRLARTSLTQRILSGVLGSFLSFGLPSQSRSAGATPLPQLGFNAFSLPLANLETLHRRQHVVGNSFFNKNWIQAPGSTAERDGLGPLFNARSCSACHRRDGRGRAPQAGPAPRSLLIRLGLGTNAPHPDYGTQLATRAIPGFRPEGRLTIGYRTLTGTYHDGSLFHLRVPQYHIMGKAHLPGQALSPRLAPPVFGLGLLEAVPPQVLEQWADPDDRNGDGISGRPNRVWDRAGERYQIGRFGWKAGQPNLRQQIASALLHDIGITSSLFPEEALTPHQRRALPPIPSGGNPEISERILDRLVVYQQTLAPPPRRDVGHPIVTKGEDLFHEAHCARCHRPQLMTGAHPTVNALSHQTFQPYTDLLLHDLGEPLADHRPEGKANGREWRTPPLWGLGLTRAVSGEEAYLHDGRARSVEEALLWHRGEAEPARATFLKMKAADRAALLRFLRSL